MKVKLVVTYEYDVIPLHYEDPSPEGVLRIDEKNFDDDPDLFLSDMNIIEAKWEVINGQEA